MLNFYLHLFKLLGGGNPREIQDRDLTLEFS